MFYCDKCKKSYSEDSNLWRCNCGAPLNYIPSKLISFPKDKIKARNKTIWRYYEALPVENKEDIITLGEGMTPLIPTLFEGQNIFFKLDYISPTGSFKDRGTSFFVSKLKEHKIKKVIEDSSGNAGASLAAYCAHSGIKCEIYVPDYTSAGKVVQIEMYGAKVRRIPGSREDTSAAAMQAARSCYYASHNWNPYFLHGVKTIAFEIWESLQKVSKLGFYIEPTSAAATAGLSQLINKGIIKPTDSTVVILTGFGLKATDKIKILKNKE